MDKGYVESLIGIYTGWGGEVNIKIEKKCWGHFEITDSHAGAEIGLALAWA